MTPLLGGDASGARHPSSGSPNEFRPNTLRNNNIGTYIRDQWNITPKITASVGVRWEYYSLPRRADHGIEVYDFEANRLLICGVGPNDENCGIDSREEPLHSAAGPCISADGRPGRPRRIFAEPAEQQPRPPADGAVAVVSADDCHHRSRRSNNVSAVGSLNDGSTIVQPADQSSGVLVLPPGAGVNTYRDEFVRGRISSWNVSVQKALGTQNERHGRIRGKSPERHVAQPQHQLRSARRRLGEPAVLPARALRRR